MDLAGISDLLNSDENRVPELTNLDMSYDDFWDLLSNTRTRYTLAYIDEFDKYDRNEVVEALADFEDIERKSIYISIYQTHEGKLEDVGILSSNGNREPDLEQTGPFGPYIEEEIYKHVRSMA